MPLLEGASHDWLVTTQGKTPPASTDDMTEAEKAEFDARNVQLEAGLVEMMKEGDQRVARAEKLDEVNAKVDALREKLREANENLTLMVTTKDRPDEYEDDESGNRKRAKAWEESKQTMQWLAKDRTNKSGAVTEDHRDIEVDTVHDLRNGGYHIKDDEDGAKLAELMKLHEQLVALQTEMEEATGPDGEPLFTARDIERELWTPLVRADVIPSNAVADKYSQEAQVWNGACEMYQKRLDEFTSAKGSKHEKTLRGLRIAGDTVMLAGTLAAESVTAGFTFGGEGAVMNRADTRQFEQLSAQKDAGGLNASELARYNELSARSARATEMKRAVAITQLTTNVINGGLKTGEAVIEARRAEKGQGTIIAKAVLAQLETITASAVATAEAEFKVSNPTLADTDAHKTTFIRLKAFTTAGFKMTQVGVSIAQACEASDEAGIKSAIIAAVNGVITSVCKAVSGLGNAEGSNGDFEAIATRTETALKGTLNVSLIVAEIVKAKREGRKLSASKIVGAFAMEAMKQVMAQTYGEIGNASRSVTSDTDTSVGVFEETGTERSDRESEVTSGISDVSGTDVGVGELTEGIGGKATEEAKLRAAFVAEMEKFVEEERAKEMSAFQESMKDEETRKEFFDACAAEADRGAEELQALIEEASASPDDLEDAESAKRAMAAMDKLIAEAQALNMKWTIIETVTGGATGILAAALPVAGLAAAIQKLAMDVALLVRKSYELNKWLDNMALTYGNNSVYGAAISGRCASAKVQVSQRAVMVVFSSVGIAVEGLKLGDCTGIATGISVANNMARALTEYGYKMQKEAHIQKGWDLYTTARDPENQGDRKLARKAMKWNSTLSKCVLAYGIVIDGDPIAQQVARSCGMNPEVLANEKDVCPKVVTYFETLYSDDPVVLRRDPKPQPWHPGKIELSLDSWMTFKSAANIRAVPILSDLSTSTPKLDAALAALPTVMGPKGYSEKRDDEFPVLSPYDPLPADPSALPPAFGSDDCVAWIKEAKAAVLAVISAANDYKPQAGPPPAETPNAWKEGIPHIDMDAVCDGLSAHAQLLLGEIEYDLKRAEELASADADRESDTAALLDSVGDALLPPPAGEGASTSEDSDEDDETTEETEEVGT